MASDDDSSACGKVLPSLLSYEEQLSPEWKALATSDERIYFVNHRTRSTHWFPPPEFWTSKLGLPYGWEAALDSHNRKYYINHVTRTTTREDPRSEADQATHLQMTSTQARRIELIRDETIGFGFVAGSEKPVVIRSVIPDGPSFNKLYANDQILKVNGMDVRDSPQVDVISLIKSSVGHIELEVIASDDVQDTKNKHNRKSSLMSRTTRERRRSTPVSVRFAGEPALVQVIGPMEPVRRSSVPLIPNVLKVFLENGQTRSFRYDCNTTAEEIFRSFASKLDLRSLEHFSLVLTGPKKGQISYIQNHEKISEIFTNRNCSSVNCLCKLNIAFVPKDHFELLSQDPNAFEYLYAQVTNMSVEGFYGVDLKYDLAIKLAALQIQQKAIEAAVGRLLKISVRQIEKEFGGLCKFVSSDLLHSMRDKEIRKALDHQIKHNENLASPGERHMSSLQCKIHYLNLAAEIFSYGGRYFDAELVDSSNNELSLNKNKRQHVTVLVNLKYGVSQVVRGKVNVLCQLAEFFEIKRFKISLYEDHKRLLRIQLQEGKGRYLLFTAREEGFQYTELHKIHSPYSLSFRDINSVMEIQLICSSLDCTDMIALITGYYKLYVDNTSNNPLPVENEQKWPFSFRRDPPPNDAPEFYSRHQVVPDVWSYPSRFRTLTPKNQRQVETTKPLKGHKDLFIDLSKAPSRYHETAISEEPGEYLSVTGEFEQKKLEQESVVTGEVEQKKLEQESVVKKTSRSPNLQCKDNADDDDYSPDSVMTQDDYSFLEKTSSVLKTSVENMDSVRHCTQSDICNGDETLWDTEELDESRKRHQASSEISDKERSGSKSIKTAAGDDFKNVDFISEVVPTGENEENRNVDVTVFYESKGEVSVSDTESLRSVTTYWSSTEGSSSELMLSVNSEQHSAHTVSGFDETDGEDDSSKYQYVEKELENLGFSASGLSDSHTSHANEGTSVSIKCNGNFQAFSDKQVNLNSAPDPQCDRVLTTSRDLGSVERKFASKTIEQMDCTENEIAFGRFDEQATLEDYCHINNATPDSYNVEPKDSKLVDCKSFESDASNKHQDLNSPSKSELSHVVLSEFVESSDSETASDVSEGEESLFSAFPEFFQPSRCLKYSGTKEGFLSLAEEHQLEYDMDDLNYLEWRQDRVPVSLIRFHSKDNLDTVTSTNGVIDAGHFEKDLEELSTTSSEISEVSCDITPDLTVKDSEIKCNRFLLSGKEKKDFCKQHDEESDVIPVSWISLNGRRRDISLETHSSSDDQEIRVAKSPSLSGDIAVLYSDDYLNLIEMESTAKASEAVVSEEPNMLLESSSFNDACAASRPSFDRSFQQSVLEFRSLDTFSDKSDHVWEDTGSPCSPSGWIIPSPPTPTPELQEDDIQVASPPPTDTVVVCEDELDKELEDLIVPPPLAESVTTISDIKIASPPPSPPTQITNQNVIDDLNCDYDEVRFLSLTDDHKIAHNKGLRVNFTADNKTKAESVEARGLFASKGTFYASQSAFSTCGTYQDNISAKTYSVASPKQKPAVPPKPLYLQSTKKKSRMISCGTIPVDKGMDASPNAKHVIKPEVNATVARTINEPEQGLNQLYTKAGLSFLPSQFHHETFFKDSNNNGEFPVQSQSQVQTSFKALGEALGLDPGGEVKSSECQNELVLNSVVESDSMSTSKKPAAFHPPYLVSTLVTSEDVSNGDEISEQPGSSTMRRSFKLMTRTQRPIQSSKRGVSKFLSHKQSVDFNEDVDENLSPLPSPSLTPDSSPPPLPETSPPKTIVGLSDDYFDFSEPLSDALEDYGQSYSREDKCSDLPSSAKELKSRRSLDELRKRSSSTDSLLKSEEQTSSKFYITCSSPRGISWRSFSEDNLHVEDERSCSSKTTIPSFMVSQNRKLGDVIDSRSRLHFLVQHQANSLETKCSKVCKEGLSRVCSFKKRLEFCLKEGLTIEKLPDERMNWLLVLQNNARFLACDVKVIVSSVRRGTAQVVSAIQASLDSLEKLVESCEKANATVSIDNTTWSVSTMVSMVIEVVEHCGDVIASVEATVDEQPNNCDLESLTEKANSLGTLIASLIRKIRKG